MRSCPNRSAPWRSRGLTHGKCLWERRCQLQMQLRGSDPCRVRALGESRLPILLFLGSALIEGEVFERPGRPRGPRGPCSAGAVAPLLLGFASSLLHSPTVVANVALTNDQRDVQDIRNNLLSFTRVLTVRESEQLLFLNFSVQSCWKARPR